MCPPRLREDALARNALLDRLDQASRHVVVRAPAGYGKTTLVRQWVERVARPVAWLTVDHGDDDPVVFFRHLVAALATVAPVTRSVVVANRPAVWDPTAALAALAADLAAAPPLALVLDDLHEITNDAVLDFGDRVLDALPATVRVVVVTRGEPGPRRRRRMLDGTLSEIDVELLRLDPREAASLLDAVCPALDAEVVELAVDRCDGWPAGLALVGLALGGADDARAMASGLSLADRPVAEYLRDEVLSGLDADTRVFMVRSAVLGTLDAPLCDATLERTDSHAVLESLARSGNLFVVGLDDGGTSYRYHHLWQELLLAELRTVAPGEEPGLRSRAAAWLEAHGRPDDAVALRLDAGQFGDAARLIADLLPRYVLGGRVVTLRRWVAAVPESLLATDPGLTLAAAWVALLSGADDDFTDRYERLGQLPPDTVLANGTPLGLAVAGLEMVSGVGGTKGTIRAADVLVEVGPDANPWWLLARMIATGSRFHAGLLEDPEDALRAVDRDVAAAPAVRATVRANLVVLLLRSGRYGEARSLADGATELLESEGLGAFAPYAGVWAAHGAAHAHAGDPAAARRSMERVEQLVGALSALAARNRVIVGLVLTDACLALGDVGAASEHLREAGRLLDDDLDAAWLQEYADELAARVEAMSVVRLLEPLSGAELRVLRELPTHRSLREIAESLYVSRNTVKTQTISIYRKLGVSNRSGAVERARELGLLAS